MTNTRGNPYIGPRAYDIQEKDRLFGRDRDITALYRLLIAERIVLLFSPSGAGKTSLVQAGLIPKMQEKGFDILPVIRLKHEIPADLARNGDINRYALSMILSLEEGKTLPVEEGDYEAKLASSTIKEYLDRRLQVASQGEENPADHNFLLIFDQFEEILSVAPDDKEGKRRFFSQLGEALDERNYWALFVIREDYVAALDPYLRFIPTRLTNTYRLDFLDKSTAQQAICKPPQMVGVDFTDEAADLLINDLRSIRVQRQDGSWETEPQFGRYVEPVQLQVVCYQLWNRIDDANIITEDHIKSLGNVDQALANYYAEQVAAAGKEVNVLEREIRSWFENQLITTSGIRTQIMWEGKASGGLSNVAILYLEEAHLIRGETRRGVKWYELAHDRLIEPIRANNKEWFEKNLSLLQRQAILWEAQDRPEHLLLRYDALKEAERWARTHELTPSEEKFLAECQELRTRVRTQAAKREAALHKQRAEELGTLNAALEQSNQRLRVRNFLAFILATIAVITGLFAFTQMRIATTQAQIADQQRAIAQTAELYAQRDRQNVEEQRNIAVEEQKKAELAAARADRELKINIASRLATQSLELNGVNSQRAILLALESIRATGDSELSNSTVSNNALRAALSTNQGLLLTGHRASIKGIAFSPDEHWLVTAGDIIQVWDLTAPDPTSAKLVLRDLSPISVVLFGPDGKWLAAGTSRGEIYLWKMPLDERSEPTKVLNGVPSSLFRPANLEITALAFSPGDGRWLVSATNKGNTILWDMKTIEDAKTLYTALPGSGVRPVTAMEISRDGKWLATGNEDNVVRLWQIDQPTLLPYPLSEIKGPVRSISFSPDSVFLAAGSDKDDAVYIWNVEHPTNAPVTLSSGTAGINALSFSPVSADERNLVVGQVNGAIKTWYGKQDYFNNRPKEQGSQQGVISAIVFSPDGHWLASGSKDSTVLLWDWNNPQYQPLRLTSLIKSITAVKFSPPGHWLAVGSDDHTVRLWRLERDTNPVEPAVVSKSDGTVFVTAPDGRSFLAIDNQKQKVTAWDLGDINPARKNSRAISQVKSQVVRAAFNGSLLGVGTDSGNIFLVDMNKPEESPSSLANVTGLVNMVFSPDGKWLTAVGNAQIKAWAMDVLESPAINYQGKINETVKSAVFSRDNRWLVAQVTQPQGQAQALVWDLNAPKSAPRVFAGPDGNIVSYDISLDGRWLAVGWTAANQSNGVAQLLDLENPNFQPVDLAGHTGWVGSVRFSPDARWLATSDGSGMVRLWQVSVAAKPVYELESHTNWQDSMEFSPDGRWLSSGNQDGSVFLVDMKALLAGDPETSFSLLGHDGPVETLVYSPDSDWLATSGDDGTIRLWGLNNPKDEKSVVVRGYQGLSLYATQFSFNGRYLLARDANNALQVVHMRLDDIKELACEVVGRNLTQQEWNLYLPADNARTQTCPQYPLP